VNTLGIGEHCTDFGPYGLFIIAQKDCVSSRFGHFPPVVRSDERWNIAQQGFRLRENPAVSAIELAGQFPRDLKVGNVFSADRDNLGPGKEDVRRLQDRVTNKTEGKREGQVSVWPIDIVRITFWQRMLRFGSFAKRFLIISSTLPTEL